MAPKPTSVDKLALDTLDKLQCRELVLFCAADERPLLAAAGFVDWRTNGWLSRLITRGVFGGRKAEMLLTHSAGRVPAERIFVFGVGDTDKFNHLVASELGEQFSEALREAGVGDVVLGLPAAGDKEAHTALLNALQKKLGGAKVTTWGPWRS